MSTFTITPLKITDVHQEQMLVRLFKQLTAKPVSINVRFLMFQSCYCFVARENDKIIGFGALTFKFVPTKGQVGLIEDVVVDENHRGKGVGEELIRVLIQKAWGNGIKTVELTSNPKRKVARKLYQKLGFQFLNTGVFRLCN